MFGKHDADADEHAGAETEILVRDGEDGAFGEFVGDHFHGSFERCAGVCVGGDLGLLADLKEAEIAFDDRDPGLDAVDFDDLQDGLAGGDERAFVDVAVPDVADVGTRAPIRENPGVVEFDLCGGKPGFAVLDVGVALDEGGLLHLHGAFRVFELGIACRVAFMEKFEAVVLRFAELEQGLHFDILGLGDFEFGLGLPHGLVVVGVVELGDEIAFLDLVADVEFQGNELGGDFRVDVEGAPRLRRAGVDTLVKHSDAFGFDYVHHDSIFRLFLGLSFLLFYRFLITLPGKNGDGRETCDEGQQNDFFTHDLSLSPNGLVLFLIRCANYKLAQL